MSRRHPMLYRTCRPLPAHPIRQASRSARAIRLALGLSFSLALAFTTAAALAAPTMAQSMSELTRRTATPTPAPTQPCQRPPDDYRKTTINGETVNRRTLWMLQLAAALYRGPGSPLRVTQGSYTEELAASFGTHDGGGVVDVSIRAQKAPHAVLSVEEANRVVLALRKAGFAAWLRLPDDLDPPVPVHIHAVAVGDRDLSSAAQRQVDSPEGYFAGYNGVPADQGGAQPDRHGGPVICQWMIDGGFVKR